MTTCTWVCMCMWWRITCIKYACVCHYYPFPVCMCTSWPHIWECACVCRDEIPASIVHVYVMTTCLWVCMCMTTCMWIACVYNGEYPVSSVHVIICFKCVIILCFECVYVCYDYLYVRVHVCHDGMCVRVQVYDMTRIKCACVYFITTYFECACVYFITTYFECACVRHDHIHVHMCAYVVTHILYQLCVGTSCLHVCECACVCDDA